MRFLSNTCPYTITSFSFFPGVIFEEKTMYVRTPCFAEIRPIFHGRQFWILGDSWLFLAEAVKTDSHNLMGRSILFIQRILMKKGSTCVKFSPFFGWTVGLATPGGFCL
jgi:hypothetical protein